MIKQARSMQGFTLMELMIVVGVIAILGGLSYPAYQDYVLRSNRSDGQAFLNDAAARQERYLAQNNAYADTTAKLGYSSSTSPGKRYTLGISATAATAYTLTATPIRTDAKCGNLTLDQAGTKGKSGTASVDDCWK